MFKWAGTVTNTKGDSLQGWQIECVLLADGTTPVAIYADENETPIETVSGVADRAVSDAQGNYQFFVNSGTYSLRFYDEGGNFQRLERYITMYGDVDTDIADALSQAQGLATQTADDAAATAADRLATAQDVIDAEAAAQAALAAGRVVADTAAGVAAYPNDGDDWFVQTADGFAYYTTQSGAAQDEGLTLATKEAVDAALDSLDPRTEGTALKIPQAPAGETQLRASWMAQSLVGQAALYAEYPEFQDFDFVADFQRQTYVQEGRLLDFDTMFYPRLAAPDADGLFIGEASENYVYIGLNEIDTSNLIANANVTTTVLEVDDPSLPAGLADDIAALNPGRWPVERVFKSVNNSGSNQNVFANLPTNASLPSGNRTVSVYAYADTINVRASTGGVTAPSNAPANTLQRLSATGTDATAAAAGIRLPAGATVYWFGLMGNAGATALPYQEGFQILNRVEPRDSSFVKPNGLIVCRWRPSLPNTGNCYQFTLANDDYTETVDAQYNFDAYAYQANARSGPPTEENNPLATTPPSLAENVPITLAFLYDENGAMQFILDDGRVIEAEGKPGIDLSGLSRLLIGGNFPNLTVAGSLYAVRALDGHMEMFAYKGFA